MFSKLFPKEMQPKNKQETFESRLVAYTPEAMMMEWHFYNKGHVIAPHDHYHAQLSYVAKGSARIILADGSEKLCTPGDAAAFAPSETHSVITEEPDTVIIDVFAPIRLDHLNNHKL